MFDFAFADLCQIYDIRCNDAGFNLLLPTLKQKINQYQQQQIRQSSMEPYFTRNFYRMKFDFN